MTKGIYQKGSVTLLAAVSWQDGTAVEVMVPEAEEFSADGSPWPCTDLEREEWAKALEEIPTMFDSEEDSRAFEKALANGRREQLSTQPAAAERVEHIARSFD